MRVSEFIKEQVSGEVAKVTPREITVTDPKSGIETIIPKKPQEPGTIIRDKQGKLILDPETPGKVAADVEKGEKITTKVGAAKKAQGTQGTQGTGQ
jgi:hypothetical protein